MKLIIVIAYHVINVKRKNHLSSHYLKQNLLQIKYTVFVNMKLIDLDLDLENIEIETKSS